MRTEDLKVQADEVLRLLPHPQAALLPLIQLLFREQDHVPEEMHSSLAEICNVSVEQVQAALAAFSLARQNTTNAFRICGDLICSINGASRLYSFLEASVRGETPVVFMPCPGYCHAAPVLQRPDGSFCKALAEPGFEPLNEQRAPETYVEELIPAST